MKAFLLPFLILFAALGGCAEAPAFVSPEMVQDSTGDEPDSEPTGHPAYDYPTEEDLEEHNETPTPEEPPAVEEPQPEPVDEPEPAQPATPVSRWKKPQYRPLPEDITGLIDVAPVDGVNTGAGIGIFGPLAFVGGVSGPLHIVDILEPQNPTVAATMQVPARDVGTILYPDDTLVAVTTGGGRDLYFIDVSTPEEPVLLTTLTTVRNNHNLAVIPGTPIIYNSPSSGTITDIIDASDPANPVIVNSWQNGDACHDIVFFMDHDRELFRGYCAGIDVIQIWDITDPLAPSVVSEFNFPTAGTGLVGGISPVTFAHLATVNHDASVLIVGDETGGGIAPGCDAYAHAAGTTVTGPLGNLWFYDIRDERNPVLHGSISPGASEDTGTCTAHFGGVIEDRPLLAMGFYNHGVLLIDFSDLDHPYIQDRVGRGNVWDVQFHQGYLLTGDMSRGMDILSFI